MNTPPPSYPVSYLDVYKSHTGFVSDKWINYFFIYDSLFSRFLRHKKPITLMEIGVQNGGSLEIWKKYLPENSLIYGVDINKLCCKLDFSEGIKFFCGNAADSDFMNETFNNISFDVILDDGSHNCIEVTKTFVNMFSKIRPGGIYIVEDLHCSYWAEFDGGFRRKNSSIEFFKNLIDGLNFDAIRIPKSCRIKTKKEIEFIRNYRKEIGKITFFDGICAIDKYFHPKNDQFVPVYTGSIEDVAGTSPYRKKLEDHVNLVENTMKLYTGD
ncbi:MAG: class I SAM-dependent methyltransferase [Bacteroidales bacterium]|nr:class I SAM-dependent methyltransferase [Bacteroidales bacterium]